MTYKETQTEKYKSFESRNQQWREGQERFIKQHFINKDRNSSILDLGCGDGVGLMYFKNLGFNNVAGVEFCKEKAEKAKTYGYPVLEIDMHDLSLITSQSINIIYASHSLEHAQNPIQVLKEMKRILNATGEIFLVLPYPDIGPDDAHCGKYLLGTDKNDAGLTLQQTFTAHEFRILSLEFDSFREPEVWVHLKIY